MVIRHTNPQRDSAGNRRNCSACEFGAVKRREICQVEPKKHQGLFECEVSRVLDGKHQARSRTEKPKSYRKRKCKKYSNKRTQRLPDRFSGARSDQRPDGERPSVAPALGWSVGRLFRSKQTFGPARSTIRMTKFRMQIFSSPRFGGPGAQRNKRRVDRKRKIGRKNVSAPL